MSEDRVDADAPPPGAFFVEVHGAGNPRLMPRCRVLQWHADGKSAHNWCDCGNMEKAEIIAALLNKRRKKTQWVKKKKRRRMGSLGLKPRIGAAKAASR